MNDAQAPKTDPNAGEDIVYLGSEIYKIEVSPTSQMITVYFNDHRLMVIDAKLVSTNTQREQTVKAKLCAGWGSWHAAGAPPEPMGEK